MAVTFSAASTLGQPSAWKRRLSYFQDGTLVCISALFVWVHGTHAYEERSVANVFFALEQSFLVVMFLTRRRTDTTSQRPMDWFVASVGGWLPLAMQPHEGGEFAASAGTAVQVLGLTSVLVCFGTLGKSFGIVAANRGLKVHGPYAIVRHPIYTSHAITLTGFVLANFWWPNLLILLTVSVFQILRIRAEERVLRATSEYSSYCRTVRWRVVPHVY